MLTARITRCEMKEDCTSDPSFFLSLSFYFSLAPFFLSLSFRPYFAQEATNDYKCDP